MSYDLHLFVTVPGEDPVATATRDSGSLKPLSAAALKRNLAAAEELKALLGDITVSKSDDCVELTWDNAGRVFQISLFEDEGGVSIPYWSANAAGDLQTALNESLRVVCARCGFAIYDPQTDGLVDLDNGGFVLDDGVFEEAVEALHQNVAKQYSPGKKPWWKFW